MKNERVCRNCVYWYTYWAITRPEVVELIGRCARTQCVAVIKNRTIHPWILKELPFRNAFEYCDRFENNIITHDEE